MLEMNGSFHKNPQRRRVDAEGVGEFNLDPPQHLPQECVRAWRDIVVRLPKVAIYSTDEIAAEVAAKWLTVFRLTGDKDASVELGKWLGKLGFSPQDRTKLAPVGDVKKNKFTDPE